MPIPRSLARSLALSAARALAGSRSRLQLNVIAEQKLQLAAAAHAAAHHAPEHDPAFSFWKVSLAWLFTPGAAGPHAHVPAHVPAPCLSRRSTPPSSSPAKTTLVGFPCRSSASGDGQSHSDRAGLAEAYMRPHTICRRPS
eukprot:1539224-Rhodomonas_salina.1